MQIVRNVAHASWCGFHGRHGTHVLHLSEAAAFGRITAARMARRLPCVLGMIEKGELTLTTVGLLAPHLTDEHQESLLDAARNMGKRDVERLIASLHPQPDVPPAVRALPALRIRRVCQQSGTCRQDFDGHFAIEPRVACSIHLAHSAGAD